ncbi:hypothetical protein OIU76_006670 [Salix suchowensis]|nr:hypothetical protein OIU78_012781 [Salix suchowensis]KAJ6336839.1 hypothetical protein OIU76_006670 [Salix suchowensis]
MASSLPDDGDLTAGEYQVSTKAPPLIILILSSTWLLMYQVMASHVSSLTISTRILRGRSYSSVLRELLMTKKCNLLAINTKLNVRNLRWLRRPSEVINTDGRRKRSRDGVLGLEGKRASLVGSR